MEGYQIFPQQKLPGLRRTIDYVVVCAILQHRLPIYFIEIKTRPALDRINRRGAADTQMRRRFEDIATSFEHIPVPVLIGISAMGTRFATYRYRTNNQAITPAKITPNIELVNDTAPRWWWRHDILRRTGEAALRALANEVKQMVATAIDG